MAGFTSGEGCFTVNLKKSPANKTGVQVLLHFSLTQHSRDEQQLKSFEAYFGCGKVYPRDGANNV